MKIQAMLLPLLAVGAIGVCGTSASAQTTPSSSGDIVGHVIAGYQGWLCEPGDGSPVGNLPAGKGNYHGNYETYPDMREFPDSERFANPRGPMTLPNGSPAPVFSSDRDFTVDIHTRWMKQYGVEVAAIQRFGEVSRSGTARDQKNDLTRRMMRASEKNGVKFYIEYDASGSGGGGWGPDFVEGVKKDWTGFAIGEKIVASPAYARQNAKPVVELWGMGLDGNNITKDPAQWKALVTWFKSQGVYVIAGTPTWWATGVRDAIPGFVDVYASCDAINPWLVGRVSKPADAAGWERDLLTPDLAWCAAHHVDYIPCVYPGTSFFNSNHKTKNIIPRANGELMWAQFATLRDVGISTCFIAMFDEYNEATAIAKTAEDATMLPKEAWFLPLDVDGQSMSSDFYLRLTSDAAKMLKGQTPLLEKLPTPYWNEIFATSFENEKDAPKNVYREGKNTTVEHCEPSTQKPQRHEKSLKYQGTALGRTETFAHCELYSLPDTTTPVGPNAILYYSIFPENENGRFVAIELHFTDGSTLTRAGCVDQNGRPLAASAGHGDKVGSIPLNAWSTITSYIGGLAGKKIDRISFVFDRSGATGTYSGYIDDLRIAN